MKINLNNYESFFLLYVDNELSPTERLLVEAFVQEFPSLAEELDQLKEMVLPAHEAIVIDKTNLYKAVSIEKKEEEAMLLLLDNELPAAAKKELLQQIVQQQALQENWTLLQKTKLDANEMVSFPDKTMLYRKNEGRVVNIGFARWAVAAALIAAGFYMGVAILNQNNQPVEVATVNNTLPKDAVTPGSKTISLVPAGTTTAKVTEGTNKRMDQASLVVAAEPKDRKIASSITKVEQPMRENITASKDKKNSKKQEPASMIAANNPIDLKIKRTENNQLLTASLNGKVKPEGIDVYEDINTYTVQNSMAKEAVFNEEESNDNHIFLLNEDVVTQSKAGVFFKKLKRTVARTAQIKTGSSLKIAGFEFAVK